MNASAATEWADASRRPSSRIQRCIKNGVAVYEKQYLPDDWGGTEQIVRERAQREVRLIESLSQSNRFGDELGLVRIESSVPSDAKIVTYEIAGDSLDCCIHDPNQVHSQQLCSAMKLAGRWIQRFQSTPLAEDCRASFSDLDPTSLRQYCALRLDSLSDYGYRWLDRFTRSRILDKIDGLESEAASEDFEEVWVHADFAPGNILWDQTTVTPIDFAMARGGRKLEDLTYFIHRLEMQSVYRPWRRWPLQQWRDSVLAGYDRPDATESPMYQVLMIKNLICRLHTYVRRKPNSQKQALHDRWVRRVLRKKLENFSV